MHYLIATLHTLGVRIQDQIDDTQTTLRTRREDGSVTIEQVLWALAAIAFAGIVVGAITMYVTNKAASIK